MNPRCLGAALVVPLAVVAASLVPGEALAADPTGLPAPSQGLVAIGAGIAIGFGALGTGIGQGLAALGALQGIARNPSAAGKIQTPMIICLALIESLAIYALVIAFFLQAKIPG